jgi:hypothetical protein
MTKVGRKPFQVCGQPCFGLGIRCADVFYLPLSARRRERGITASPFSIPALPAAQEFP